MIKLYVLKTEAFLEEKNFLKGCRLIDDTRLCKVKACKRKADKARSLGCGLLLQYAMQETAGRDNCGWKKLKLEYMEKTGGKPYFAASGAPFFSLSHSGNYAALALSWQEIGLDIQQIRSYGAGLAERVLSKPEYAQYQKAETKKEQEKIFFCGWCARESYGKLTGKGLLLPLSEFFYNQKMQMMADVCCHTFPFGREYYGGVCTASKIKTLPALRDVTDEICEHILL